MSVLILVHTLLMHVICFRLIKRDSNSLWTYIPSDPISK